jgi:5-methyltetrahydropteroyltriglutamate--homocysteine methyltransferase
MSKGKIKQDKILTAIVGSYPKPKFIYKKSGRDLLDEVGISFYQGKGKEENILDKAVLQAIEDQNLANIDIETDGEERRGHYVLHVLKGLEGIDFKNLKKVSIRGGTYERSVPTVKGRIKYKGSILVDEFKFTQKNSKGFAKIGLPGPSTVVDCVADEYYKGDIERLAFDYAKAIRNEVKALIEAGCRVIQFDDPVLLRYPDRAKKWGLKALEECFRGLTKKATFIVHICCGYPNKPLEKKGISYKANHDYYKEVLSWLAKSSLDIVSIEGAQSNLDLSVLPAIGRKSVMLGVLDVGIDRVETTKSLVERGREALKYIKPSQLILGPDCGMLQLSREVARNKLKNMSEAAKILNS